MAVASVAGHDERHVNPLVEHRLERPSGTSAAVNQNASNSAVAEDTFTPSNQGESTESTAQAAGIFHPSQAATTANAAPAQTTPATTSNADSGPAAGTSNANATAVDTQPTAGAPTAASATLGGAANTEQQGQVQALNTELAALGLSNYDILQIDRIATVIQNYNPSAYTDLVNQFERQVQESQQLTTPPPASNSGSAASPPAAANASAGATLSSSLTGAQETVNPIAANAGNLNSATSNPLPGGQVVQVQAPQQNSGVATANQPSSQSQSSAA